MNALFQLAVTAALACSLHAATIVVDDDGGPGVDFTDIQPALDAASPGDVVLVQPGFYGGYVMTVGVRLIGASEPPVVGGSSVEIRDVPAGQVAVVSNFEHIFDTSVADCAGTVMLDRLELRTTTSLTVIASADVRAHDLLTWGQARVAGSRFEATSSLFRGANSSDSEFCPFGPPGPGQLAFAVESGAFVHLSLCTVEGGNGGGVGMFCPTTTKAGDGGAGLRVESGGQVLYVGGGSSIVSGGKPGYGFSCAWDGIPGNAVEVAAGGAFTYSNVGFLAGTNPVCSVSAATILEEGGVVVDLGVGAPTLASSGATAPGATCTFTIRGLPSATALFGFGAQPILAPYPGWPVGILTSLDLALATGVIPASGPLTLPVAVPTPVPVGTLAVVQAAMLTPSGSVQLTSSLPWIVAP